MQTLRSALDNEYQSVSESRAILAIETQDKLESLPLGAKILSRATGNVWWLTGVKHTPIAGTGGGYTFIHDFLERETQLELIFLPETGTDSDSRPATASEPCGSRGPRIGSEGRPLCELTRGHSQRHQGFEGSGFENETW